MQKILIIQTAFIGDVVLATALAEKLHVQFPQASIDFLVRKGNEGLLENHPFLHAVLVWDKKSGKNLNLWKMLRQIRANRYDLVVNAQRFAATGLLTAFSGAKEKVGFDKNPFSFLFSKKIPHVIGDAKHPVHEIDRNQNLIRDLTGGRPARPRLHPSAPDWEAVRKYKELPYVTISPASVWFTKQYPAVKWISFIRRLPAHLVVYLLGAPSDQGLCEEILRSVGDRPIISLAGSLSFLRSAALMQDAQMNFVNDSAPMHFASAMNAPVTAIYCSTIPGFGFGPLSDQSHIVEIKTPLDCRPCGLHGFKACPRGHFQCAMGIDDTQLLESLP